MQVELKAMYSNYVTGGQYIRCKELDPVQIIAALPIATQQRMIWYFPLG